MGKNVFIKWSAAWKWSIIARIPQTGIEATCQAGSTKGQFCLFAWDTCACREPSAIRTESFIIPAVLSCTQHGVVSQAFLQLHSSRLTLMVLNTVTRIWAIWEICLIQVSSRSGKSISVSVSGNWSPWHPCWSQSPGDKHPRNSCTW